MFSIIKPPRVPFSAVGSPSLTPRQKTRFFKVSGISYKGQIQHAYDEHGGGAEFSFCVDPTQLAIGIFKTELSASVSGASSKKVFLILHRLGPCSELNGANGLERPVGLNCLVGRRWQARGQLSVFAGIGANFSLGVGQVVPPPSTNLPATLADPVTEKLEGMEAELLSLGFSLDARAGVSASGAASYDFFYADDRFPLYFKPDNTQQIDAVLQSIISEGSYKSAIKRHACNFINRHTTFFKPINFMQTVAFVHQRRTPIDDIISNLEAGVKVPGITDSVHTEARSIINALKKWREPYTPPTISTFLLVSTINGHGAFELTASASASAQLSELFTGEAGAAISALNLQGKGLVTSTRYQTAFRKPDNSHLVITQFTQQSYSQFSFKPFSGSLSGSAAMPGHKMERELKTESDTPDETINQLAYQTATLYWEYKGPDQRAPVTACTGTGISIGRSFSCDTLEKMYRYAGFLNPADIHHGSTALKLHVRNALAAYKGETDEQSVRKTIGQTLGVASQNSIPASKVLHQLVDIEGHDDLLERVVDWLLGKPGASEPDLSAANISDKLSGQLTSGSKPARLFTLLSDAHRAARLEMARMIASFSAVATALQVTPGEVAQFFRDVQVMNSLRSGDENHVRVTGFILEASFTVPGFNTVSVKRYDQGANYRVEINEQSAIDLFEAAKTRKTLQSIALRYRIQDHQSNASNPFPLGFTIMGQGISVALKQIDESGSSGMVDLAKVWFDASLARTHAQTPAAAYEPAVPAVALFTR